MAREWQRTIVGAGVEGSVAAIHKVGELVDAQRAAAVVVERLNQQLNVTISQVLGAHLWTHYDLLCPIAREHHTKRKERNCVCVDATLEL